MRTPLIIASIVCSLVLSPWSLAAAGQLKKPQSSRKQGLSIRVLGGGWGGPSAEEIEPVLYAVADELLTRIPAKLTTPIVVTHTNRNPVALYDKGPNGEYQVQLHAAGRYWHRYVYEFAHELCHILSNYEAHADTTKHNQWFEETLCETASLHTLKSLARTWETAAPSAQFAAHAPALRRFADEIINEGHRRLPADTPLAAWLRENEAQLRKDPYLRDKNEVVANLLLPLFERNPESLDALCYMNLGPGDAKNSLRDYLHNWYHNAPAEHRLFVAGILELLGLSDIDLANAAPTELAPTQPVTAPPAGQAGPAHR